MAFTIFDYDKCHFLLLFLKYIKLNIIDLHRAARLRYHP